jgi:tetraacyldisaccharide 4'-kinase
MREPEFWSRQTRMARLKTALLSPVARSYGAVTRWKRTHASPYRATAKVICVGNLTSGGTGKTPVAVAVAAILRAQHLSPSMLSRGYGGRIARPTVVDVLAHSAADVGDEAMLLASAGRTIVARNRAKGAHLADSLGTDVIVMDDGYQNFTLHKDLSLLVVDAETGFGNGRVLPNGPLREPVSEGLAHADAVVLVGYGSPALPGFNRPVFRAQIVPRGGTELSGQRLFAFAGIGRPEKFFATLRSLGAEVVESQAFPDHHAFRRKEILQLKKKALHEDAMLITTEKDYARLSPEQRNGIKLLTVRAQFEMPQLFEQFISDAIHRTPA